MSNSARDASLREASLEEMAEYLRDGYWSWYGVRPHSFNLGSTGAGANNGVLKYNLAGWSMPDGKDESDFSGLTPEGATLARAALQLYANALNITFVETRSTTDDVDLFFSDNKPGAYAGHYAEPGTVGRVIDDAYVNISTEWLEANGTGFDSYSFQTYVHEIGHALGLGHPGGYDDWAIYVTSRSDPDYSNNSNVFLNDSWQVSIMSYFDQAENTNVDADRAHVITPMAADWIALDGFSTYEVGPVFDGDTLYGVGTNISASRSVIWNRLAKLADKTAFNILDTGGKDTVDFSGYTADQRITLKSGGISDVGGLRGNMTVSPGTVIENATTGGGNDRIDGNDVANILRGNSGADTLSGHGGTDSLHGGAGSDRLFGGDDDDRLFGGDDSDRLFGGGGNDLLVGGGGGDWMEGGAGNDTYRINKTSQTVVEKAGQGRDLVKSSISFNLATDAPHVEDLTLTGSLDLKGTGTGADNYITGSRGDNVLLGRGGDDVLIGQSGADRLDGGTGADRMEGGTGDDIYLVESRGDTIIEHARQGRDVVISDISASLGELGAHLEVLRLRGDADHKAVGNASNNRIVGNAGDNVLNGAAGDDTLIGGAGNDRFTDAAGSDFMRGGQGNDIYLVNDTGDRVHEGAGRGDDTINSSIDFDLGADGRNVETLRLTGGSNIDGAGNGEDNLLIGNAGRNTLEGRGGRDTLDGGTGRDLLTGGGEADRFVFEVGDGSDTITDFGRGGDMIHFSGKVSGYRALTMSQDGAHARIEYGRSDVILVLDTSIDELSADVFSFAG